MENFISIENQIEKPKDSYYDVLEISDAGWHEEKNDLMPFIRYMLSVILACYTDFEERIGIISESGTSSRAYDIVRKYTEEKIGKFTEADVLAHCPSIGRSSALATLKKLVEEGIIERLEMDAVHIMCERTVNKFRHFQIMNPNTFSPRPQTVRGF